METIQFSNKKLTSFDQIFQKLKNPKTIKHIDLSYNRLQNLPDNLAKFSNLTTINLIGNPIKKVC